VRHWEKNHQNARFLLSALSQAWCMEAACCSMDHRWSMKGHFNALRMWEGLVCAGLLADLPGQLPTIKLRGVQTIPPGWLPPAEDGTGAGCPAADLRPQQPCHQPGWG
jgi:hypothetical protein